MKKRCYDNDTVYSWHFEWGFDKDDWQDYTTRIISEETLVCLLTLLTKMPKVCKSVLLIKNTCWTHQKSWGTVEAGWGLPMSASGFGLKPEFTPLSLLPPPVHIVLWSKCWKMHPKMLLHEKWSPEVNFCSFPQRFYFDLGTGLFCPNWAIGPHSLTHNHTYTHTLTISWIRRCSHTQLHTKIVKNRFFHSNLKFLWCFVMEVIIWF